MKFIVMQNLRGISNCTTVKRGIYHLLVHVFLIANICQAQNISKPSLDISALKNWPEVSSASISNNGSYTLCKIDNWNSNGSTVVIRNLSTGWKLELDACASAQFTADNKNVIYVKSNDSLCIRKLESDSIRIVKGVTSYKLFMQDAMECIAYQNSSTKDFVIENLTLYKQHQFTDVNSYSLSDDGKSLLLNKKINGNNNEQALYWVDIILGKSKKIWEGKGAENFVISKNASRIAFLVKKGSGVNSLWLYKVGMDNATSIIDDSYPSIKGMFRINRISKGFNSDATSLFFEIKEIDYPKVNPENAMINVWSYKDIKLQSEQLGEINPNNWKGGPRSYSCVLSILDGKIIRLQHEDEEVMFFDRKNEDIVFITKRKADWHEENWNPFSKVNYYLQSTTEDKRIQMTISVFDASPDGKFLIGWDSLYQNYYSYEVATGSLRNITRGVELPVIKTENDRPGSNRNPMKLFGIGSWFSDKSSLFVYDRFDIWKLDISGRKIPENVTNSYGRKNNIVFRLAEDYSVRRINVDDTVILSAFDRNTKHNGFYFQVFKANKDPELLYMGPYIFDIKPGVSPVISAKNPPLKALNAKKYIVQRQDAESSKNYLVTENFKTFTPLSSVYPERSFNWLTAELLKFKSLDGNFLQGIIYKPENFDIRKKYPVIIHFYERKTDRLNLYQRPDFAMDNINIPWFVSNGFLVFTPDINYVIGEPGQSAFNSVVAAATHLSKYPFVDSSKIALQGHSWGGYQTNYIITHTNIFAAAMSASGVSNFISSYGGVRKHDGHPRNFIYESEQSRIGTTLWDRPDLYIKNSPIFSVDKIKTPVLLMSNENDGSVPFAQGVEFFTALRRLQKKAWMLQYDDAEHSLYGEKNGKDYTIRMTQFFNHYLKSAPPPIWMSQGIPAKLKGIETGYAYDPAGNCGKDCNVCKSWNSKMATNPTATLQEIERRKKQEHWE